MNVQPMTDTDELKTSASITIPAASYPPVILMSEKVQFTTETVMLFCMLGINITSGPPYEGLLCASVMSMNFVYETVTVEFEKLVGKFKDKTSAWIGMAERLVEISANAECSTKIVEESTGASSERNNKCASLNPVCLGDVKEQSDIRI